MFEPQLDPSAPPPPEPRFLDFSIHNSTGFVIWHVFISPSSSSNRGDDWLRWNEVIFSDSGYDRMFTFASSETEALWDIRVEFNDYSYVEFDSIDLKSVEVLEIELIDGKYVGNELDSIPVRMLPDPKSP